MTTTDGGGPTRIAERTGFGEDVAALLAVTPEFKAKFGDRPHSGPDFFAIMAHNPELLRLFKPLSAFFGMQGLLPDRHREIAILRIAWRDRLAFIWGEHVVLGHRYGLSSEEIDHIAQGPEAAGLDAHERAILRAVDELHESADIADDTWAALAEGWSEAQMIELPALVGQYQSLGYLQKAVRLPLCEGNPGLSAR